MKVAKCQTKNKTKYLLEILQFFLENNTINTDIIKINMTNVVNEIKTIKWDRFSEWIHCICVVTFDLELGQAMEVSLIIFHSFLPT